ncbi:MAG: glycoside hydrolase family 15 protein [Alphaproteobacteria bacterium]|nr:glycoside hydrolase family 15 protein [Alphaproteobacteria bacterium]
MTFPTAQSCNTVNDNNPFTPQDLRAIQGHLLANIATDENTFTKNDEGVIIRSRPGAVIASLSNQDTNGMSQDYIFHWVRDAAIVMQEVVFLYKQAQGDEKTKFHDYLIRYINFEQESQNQAHQQNKKDTRKDALGEPKYNIDGTIWQKPWRRPQNDGPAFRALTMMSVVDALGSSDALIDIIKTDLDYVASEWDQKSYCVWEEVADTHLFFTNGIQRKALIKGVAFLESHKIDAPFAVYQEAAKKLGESLERHWDESLGYFAETMTQQDHKGGGVNSSVLLGLLHGDLGDASDPLSLGNDRVMSTIFFLRHIFANLYKINLTQKANGCVFLGRYPNDIYDGDQFRYGNPWFLITAALAEYYYRLAPILLKQGHIEITTINLLFWQQIGGGNTVNIGMITAAEHNDKFHRLVNCLIQEGDQILKTITGYGASHQDDTSCHFSEQLDRVTGQQVGAKDLLWTYAALLSATRSRQVLFQKE